MNAAYLTSFLAGLVSFASPCVLPLVPAYISYLAGSSFEELTAGARQSEMRRRIFFASLLFVAGFTTVFVVLGASASVMGQMLRTYQDVLSKIAGVMIILFGLHFLGLLRLPFLNIERRFPFPRGDGVFSAYGMGLAFAFGWTPCIGPVLAAVLTLAARRETLADGMLQLTCYSIGLGAPFVLAGLMLPLFLRTSGRASRFLGWVEKFAGAVLVLTGVLFLSGDLMRIAGWLIEAFPGLTQLG